MTTDSNFLGIIRQHSYRQSFPANLPLFRQGDPIRDVYLLEKGIVKMTRGESNGQEIILDLRMSGSLLGAVSALANDSAPMAAITATPCEAYRLSSKDFLHLVNSDAKLSQDLMEFISRQRNEQVVRQAEQSMLSVRARLIKLLSQIAKEFGVERNGRICLPLPITKQDIAGFLAITPQHLSIIFKEMKKDGLIAEEKEWIIFQNLQALIQKVEILEKKEAWV